MTRSSPTGRLACLVQLLFLACARNYPAPKGASVDTLITFVATGPAVEFPQVYDSTRVLDDGSIRPDTAAPPCSVVALPDTRDWVRSQVTLSLAHWRGVSVRLPRGFSPQSAPEGSDLAE